MQELFVGNLSLKFEPMQNPVEFDTFIYVMYYFNVAVRFAYYWVLRKIFGPKRD
jgi:hypothetical protein